ncbi:MAG TPA: hypothetical protein PLB45_00850 [Bacilli bacterium]|jgi:DNA-directed RNA polymerase alpha subunit|nr:hypothetical protein [Bacilli bacterium]HPZ23456.1 hypothetical protein [Bacilli bacterium]HQC83409.1 hypothetical protein [Bacilli bacterium]
MARRKCEYVNEDIKLLELDSSIENKLNDSGLKTIGDVWASNRKSLKALGLRDMEIKQIIIKLQLLGLDLNKKIYN